MLPSNYDGALQEASARFSQEVSSGLAATGLVESDLARHVERARRIVSEVPGFAKLADAQLDEAARFVVDDMFQLGPLEELLADSSVTEIMVNAFNDVWVERGGMLERAKNVHFFDDGHVERVITRIVQADNRRCDTASPTCDCTLHRAGAAFDGSRVNAVWRPIAIEHPILTIRKFRGDIMSPETLIANGTMDETIWDMLCALVKGRMNIMIIGGTGTGKTTVLNMLSTAIDNDQRIFTIEDTAELKLMQEHWVREVSRQPNSEGAGEVTIRQLVRNVLRQRPDRIIVGECRGAEAFDMLRAMSSGHDGSLTTLHSSAPRQSLMTLQMLVQMNPDASTMPPAAIMQLITSSIDFVVHVKRYRDGSRRIAEIMEVSGMQGEVPTCASIIEFRETGLDAEGRVTGEFMPTGNRFQLKHREQLENSGVVLDESWFDTSAGW